MRTQPPGAALAPAQLEMEVRDETVDLVALAMYAVAAIFMFPSAHSWAMWGGGAEKVMEWGCCSMKG